MDMNFNTYIIPGIVGLCSAIGGVIKHKLPVIPNKYIPAIMGGLGCLLNVMLNGFDFSDIGVLLTGVLSGFASTGAFEVVKNLKTDKK